MMEMRFETPKTAEAASALIAATAGLSKIFSGGTDLMVHMRSGNIKPELVLDIKSIAEMNVIAVENGGYRVGAAVNCMQLLENTAFAAMWPGVIDGANLVGSIQVRGRATLGGNLCNASPGADTVPAMIAAGETKIADAKDGETKEKEGDTKDAAEEEKKEDKAKDEAEEKKEKGAMDALEARIMKEVEKRLDGRGTKTVLADIGCGFFFDQHGAAALLQQGRQTQERLGNFGGIVAADHGNCFEGRRHHVEIKPHRPHLVLMKTRKFWVEWKHA